MNYGIIKNYDIANGTGVRVSLFVSGCRHHCKGFSLLGGEPFEPENQKELAGLLQKIKESYPEKNVWCYTGYLYDVDLIPGGKVYTEYTDKMLACIDTLVDGEFIEAEKDLTLEFRGSRNQRILHLNEMRKNAKN